MRLAEFILANVEAILVEWEAFARSIWPKALIDASTDPAKLRDHAEAILRTSAIEMNSIQTPAQQANKSKGEAGDSAAGERVNRASESHGSERYTSGFELWAVISEYRALRASVIQLWRNSDPEPDLHDLGDITRFNECMDQSLTEAVRTYTQQVEKDREKLLKNEQDANLAKDMFLATLSHEMRTPLNAIVGWIAILRMVGSSKTDLTEGLNVIERNTNAQVKLIEDVLDVSRIVSGKLNLEIADCDIAELIKASMESVRPAADAKDISLSCKLDPSAGLAQCDPARITQIIWNLLSNALKFTNKGGHVRVTLRRDRSDLRIAVSDDGEGISADLLPFVFDRFRQSDNSTRRHYGGLGLGLSIVKHLAEMHGGTAEVQSTGVGRGSTFAIRLPIRAVAEVVDVENAPSEPGGGLNATNGSHSPNVRLDGIRVLVVDDQADAREILRKVLEGIGATVTLAASAAEALVALTNSKAKNLGPDILVSDVGMPEHNGYDLIREVRLRGHLATELPAVALTAFAHDKDARDAMAAGFQVHISKPVSIPDLTSTIAKLAAKH
ncbi:hybrid sensor histidine kinase/response regulator [Lacipirellula sp.]|uniref:hybrid sensor histidine kinase/response regulator n=1 Tax=Lacipirellula sp. TaxID=2691419 RepID=UPI003D0CD523